MFNVRNPASLESSWYLSRSDDSKPVYIPPEVTKSLQNYHILGIQFLYNNYKKGLKGSIVNEEDGMNFPLQVSAFLGAILNGEKNSKVIVVCSRRDINCWHYHLTHEGNFRVCKINQTNSKDDYNGTKEKLALLLDITDLKILENLQGLDLFAVILDDFDLFAHTRPIKKLEGLYHIGLTRRSFYTHPNQRLQWRMLNWANPGCVGKLSDFYEVDNRNLENLQDSYRFWWFRLTWHFCESFQKPTKNETENYNVILNKWALGNNLQEIKSPERKVRKRSKVPTQAEAVPPTEKYVKLPSMDENPILTSIIKNFESEPTTSVILLHCSKGRIDQDEEKPCSSKSCSEQFILDLIENDHCAESDIQELLKEADALLED